MASNVVPCHLTTPKKVNFARLSRLVIDLFARILRDILVFYYPRPDDLQQKITGNNLEQKFKKDRDRILHGDSYEKCDVSLLYTLIRYTCDIKPPTVTYRRKMEWGGDRIPSRDCTTLGDEIERIRIIRNRVLGHVPCTELENNEFEKYFQIAVGICKRLTGLFGTKDYVNELETIRTCRMETDPVVILTEKVNEVIKMNEEMRNYFGKETRRMGRKINKVYQEMNKKRKNNDGRNRKNTKVKKQQQDSGCPKYDYFFRNIQGIQGSAVLPTIHAIDLQMQTENHDIGISRNNILVNNDIITRHGRRGGRGG